MDPAAGAMRKSGIPVGFLSIRGLAIAGCVGKVPAPVMTERRTPIWLWPNLLSLDAPFVAVVWLAIFARSWRVDYHEWQAYVALALAVWGLYIVDRAVDLKLLPPSDARLTPRHTFQRRWAGPLLWAGFAALLAAAALALFKMPSMLIGSGLGFSGANQMGHLTPAAVLLLATFGLSVSASGSPEIPYLRNLLAGITFSYGTAMLADIYRSNNGPVLLLVSPEVLAFAFLCAVNISAIQLWEHSRSTADPEIRAADELALTLPLCVLGAASIVLAVRAEQTTLRPFYYAILISSALLFILNRNRARFSTDALRVLADVALVAPYPIFLVLSRS